MHDHGDGFSHKHALPSGGWRNVLVLGATGGLLPCPSAMVVMLSAISLNRIGFGLVLIVFFSMGLAAVLVAMGFALVHGRGLLERARWPQQPFVRTIARFAPVVSAVVITCAGVWITARAVLG